MATKSTTKATTTKPAETVEQTPIQIVEAGIKQVVADHGIDIQKARYKAMRAIAWQAFIESIQAGDFEALVQRASANVDGLPAGWEIDAAHKPAPKAAVKPAAKPVAKPAAKAPAKPAAKAPVKRAAAAKPAAPAAEAKPARRAKPAAPAVEAAATTEAVSA